MDIEMYIKWLRKKCNKFTEQDIEAIRGLLQLNIDLQKSTVGLRKKVAAYNERINVVAHQKIAELADEYAKNGDQCLADALKLVAAGDRFEYEPYIVTIRKLEDYRECPIGKSRDSSVWKKMKEDYVKAGEHLKGVIEQLQTNDLFSKDSADYRFRICCITRFNRLTFTHDELDYIFDVVRKLKDYFTIGMTFRDSEFQKALEEMDREEFLTWYSAETIKEQKNWTMLKDEYESKMATEPDNQN